MTITIELPAEVAEQVQAEANRRGQETAEYVRELVEAETRLAGLQA